MTENGTATIKSGITEFNIHAMPVTDYPELPIPSAEPTLDLSAAELKEIVETTLYAVSLDETKPAHTGELFEITPDALRVVALDGYRLAIVEKKVAAQKEISIIVPGKTLSDVIKLFGDSDDTVHISADRRFVVFANEHYKVFSRLLEGQFLDYKRVIPAAGSTRVVVDVRDFIDVIERASLIITERAKIRFGFCLIKPLPCDARRALALWWMNCPRRLKANRWRLVSTTVICLMRCATRAVIRWQWKSAARSLRLK